MKYSQELELLESPLRVIYISSYIPRKCGIATFTKDLTTAINNQNPYALAEIIAMDDLPEGYEYPWEVKLRIKRDEPNDYLKAAEYINQSSADIVNLQHEFGLFGGVAGDYILPMLDLIQKPIITVFHTVLPDPDEHKRYIMQRIIERSSAIIALTKKTKQDLIQVYGVKNPDKISVIYHGVPDFDFHDTVKYKKSLRIKQKNLILMTGLLSRGKGAEYVIESLPAIVDRFPDTVFYLVGETHPAIVRAEKEEYRDSLKRLIRKLKITRNVKMVNEFMELKELTRYFKAADIYITPHLDPQQGSSGTLSKAMAAGCVCISTPYAYAKEMLDEGRGILVPFRDSEAIANSIIDVLSNPDAKLEYEKNAYKMGKLMQWPNVASKYLALFRLVSEHRRRKLK
jgi:polysaccharide biosynthesis protein PslF